MDIIKVLPASAGIRATLRHPTAGAFPKEGAAAWPNDQFTHRRLNDGDVTREAATDATAVADGDAASGQRRARRVADAAGAEAKPD